MKARDVMTQPVMSVEAETPVQVAIRLMLRRKISGLPVVNACGNLVGMVTEGDFLRRAESGTEHKRSRWLDFLMGPGLLADQYTKTHGRKVGEVMTPNVKSVDEHTSLGDIVAMMERHRIKRVPVLRGKKLIGIVTRANLLRALASVIHKLPPAKTDDVGIRQKILDQLQSEKWAPVATVDAIVRDGVVTLTGYVLDERQRAALKVLVENVPGVTQVRDQMVWVEPMSGVTMPSDEMRDEMQKGAA
jgi:CBS-domain-containing membrane protein